MAGCLFEEERGSVRWSRPRDGKMEDAHRRGSGEREKQRRREEELAGPNSVLESIADALCSPLKTPSLQWGSGQCGHKSPKG
eukprot:191614-Chlamydomonas_euryale.AAC.4